jgi:hypothetical protein
VQRRIARGVFSVAHMVWLGWGVKRQVGWDLERSSDVSELFLKLLSTHTVCKNAHVYYAQLHWVFDVAQGPGQRE